MRNDEDKKVIWDVFGNDQKTSVGKRVSKKEVGIHLVHHTPMEEVSVGRWENWAASSVMTTSASGLQKSSEKVCVEEAMCSSLALASSLVILLKRDPSVW